MTRVRDIDRTVDLSEPVDRRFPWRGMTAWTVATLAYTLVLREQIGLPLLSCLLDAAFYFYTLAALMVPVRRLSRRLVSVPRRPGIVFGAHVVIALVVTTVWQGTIVLFERLVVGPDFWSIVYAATWMFQLLANLTTYGAALGITLASLAWERERERARREHELVVAARDAQLALLKAQFQPHFMLNALNSLLALIDTDPPLARTMVVGLADLMKSVFDRADIDEVPFEHELDLTRAYLDVERIRFGARLSVTFDVADAARGVRVPAFLLQPIVENAVKHGVAPFAEAGRVAVEAKLVDRRLRIVVRDSGRGFAPGAASGLSTGRGLQITRRRLDGAYGDGYRLTCGRRENTTVVELDLPANRADVA